MTEHKRLTRQQLRDIKKMSLEDLNRFMTNFFLEAFEQGLREAEKEFSNPDEYVIMDADDVRAKLGDEMYERLMGDGEILTD